MKTKPYTPEFVRGMKHGIAMELSTNVVWSRRDLAIRAPVLHRIAGKKRNDKKCCRR